jgi:hypothetical protein
MIAEATGTLYAPPDLVKNSPGVAKAWTRIEGNGTLDCCVADIDYNVASVTDTCTGDRTVVWDADFSGTNLTAFAGGVSGGAGSTWQGITSLAGSLRVKVYNASESLVDDAHWIVGWGVRAS